MYGHGRNLPYICMSFQKYFLAYETKPKLTVQILPHTSETVRTIQYS